MQKTHFDLGQVEASIRDMFAKLPPAPPNAPAAVLQGQMVEMTVAFELFKFDQANKGLTPDEVFPAMLVWMADRIADMCIGEGNLEASYERQSQSLDIISEHLNMINSYRADGGDETSGATGIAYINPMQTGNA